MPFSLILVYVFTPGREHLAAYAFKLATAVAFL